LRIGSSLCASRPIRNGPVRPPGGEHDANDPEAAVLLADAVGPALMVVLDTLAPAERLAFVLHDIFAVPFDEIAAILERSPAASRQLASRARRRVQGATPPPDADPGRQRELVADQVGHVVEVGGGVDDVLGDRPAERGQPAQVEPGPQDAVRLGQGGIGAGVGAGVRGGHVTISIASAGRAGRAG